MKPGIYTDLSNAEYHGGPGASNSFLALVSRSPLHAKYARDTANDRQPTAAQAFGTAFHTLVLEPAEFAKNYCLALRQSDVPDAIADRDTLVAMVAKLNETRLPKLSASGTKDELALRIIEARAPNIDGATRERIMGMKAAELKAEIEALNTGRPGLLSDRGTMPELRDILNANGHQVTLWSDVKAQWLENNGHRIVLEQEAWDRLHAMRDAIKAHPAANALFYGVEGWAERSVYWTDPVTGELCRCRPDFWRKDGVIVDLKSCLDASQEGFAKSIHNWRYHVQHPYYQDGVNLALEQSGNTDILPIKAFVFVAVESQAPHAVGVYMLDREAQELGRQQYRRDLNTLHQCNQTNTWPGYGDNIQNIGLPAWAFTKDLAA